MSFLDNFQSKFVMENNGIRLPEVHIVKEDYKYYGLLKSDSALDKLTKICRFGYAEKLKKGLIPKERAKEYGDRVRYEISVLDKTDFVDYILMVWTFIRERDRRGLTKSHGRGSCAGSLICDLIGITDCDPIEHDLFFERFLSENRASTQIIDGVKYLTGTLPDIDADVPDEGRHEIIKFIEEKYPERFVKLSTHGTYATKALTGELCKVFFGWKKEEYEFLTKEVVSKSGRVPSPEEVIAESDIYKKFCEENPMFYRALTTLHECINSCSSHASAYFLSYDPLTECMPIQYGKKKKDNGEDSDEIELISTYDMYTSEELGVKVDILGLKSLTIVGNVAKAVGLDISTVDLNDYDTIYSHFENLEFSYGLFQISGDTAVRCLNKVKPRNLEQLSAVTSLARPGALEFVDDYADYVNNGTLKSLHPLFDDIVQKTGLQILFQEQTMALFNRLGFSLLECETLRRGIGKKDKDKINEIKAQAYERAKQVGAPKEAVDIAVNVAEKSASYSFNKCCAPSTIVETPQGYSMMYEIKKGDLVKAYDIDKKQDHFVEVLDIVEGKAELFEIELDDGRKIITSLNHKYLTDDGMLSLKEIIKNKKKVITD